jgi:uncharacterized protein (TIGR02453 family)
MPIQKETLQFLKDLKKNNNREWFNKNKNKYVAANENFLDFVQDLIGLIAAFDKSVKGLEPKDTVFRIYRDVRFSKDKSPYKTHFGTVLSGKDDDCNIAGYYFHFEPGASFLAGGSHMTEPAKLKAIRQELSYNGKEFLRIISDKTFKKNFEIHGEKLKNVPPGYDKEDPMADYLKFKELIISHHVDDKQILEPGFAKYCTGIFKSMVPFNSFINDAVAETV